MSILKTGLLPVNQGIDNLLDFEKINGRVNDQVNMFSTLRGVQKRAGLELLKNIDKLTISSADLKIINLNGNDYIMIHTKDTNNPLLIYDLNGNAKTINYNSTSAKNYFSFLNTGYDYAYTPFEDSKGLISSTKTIAGWMKTRTDTVPKGASAVIEVKVGVGEQWYSVDVKDRAGYTDRTFSVQAAAATASAPSPSTIDIAEALYNDLTNGQASGEILENMIITREDNIIYIYAGPLAQYETMTFGVHDSQGNSMMKIINNDQVNRVQELTTRGLNNRVVHVLNESAEEDDFFIKWDNTSKTWKETVPYVYAPYTDWDGQQFEIEVNPTNLPKVIYESGGQIYIEDVEWKNREVGTEFTAPLPSFLKGDAAIKDVFLFKNRLGILSEHGVSFSRSGDFSNFFPKSGLYGVDTDPIDITLDDEMLYAVPMQDTLVLFGRNKQYVINSVGGLTPLSIAVTNATKFDLMEVRPLLKGNEIFFLTRDKSLYSYLISPETGQLTAQKRNATFDLDFDSYYPVIRNLNDESICIFNQYYSFYPNAPFYVYQHKHTQDSVLLDAWSKFEFMGLSVLGVEAVHGKHYLLGLSNEDSRYAFLYKGNLLKNEEAYIVNNPPDQPKPYKHLDSLIRLLTPSYNSSTDQSTIDLSSYPNLFNTVPKENFTLVNLADYLDVDFTVSGTDLILEGDYSGTQFYLGIPVQSSISLPNFYLRDRNGLAVTVGRTQLRQMLLYVDKSGPFKVEMERESRDTQTYEYNSLITSIGISDLTNFFTLKAAFYVGSTNNKVKITIKSDNYYPLNIKNVEYLIQYHKYYRR